MNQITRRTFLARMSTGAAAMAMAPLAFGDFSGMDHPNVLFLAVDDLNDWVGCMGGHPDALTPTIDDLASRGVLFERAYCSAPACNPSRASLLCGLRPSTSGIYKNNQDWHLSPIMQHAATLPKLFMHHDYNVWGCGKIFHGKWPSPDLWHEYFYRPASPVPPELPAHGIPDMGNVDWGPVDCDDSEMGDTQVADWAIDKLQQTHTKPFFIACGIFRPHLPWYAPRKYFDKFPPASVTLPTINEQDLDDVPPIPRDWANTHIHDKIMAAGKWSDAVAAYLACGNYTDTQLGRVVDALDASPYANNTIIVLWTDHGWHLAEKLHYKKFTLWEEATRVPFIIIAPGVTSPGQRCPRTVTLLDIYPTLCGLCGLTPRSYLEGSSLVPLLHNPHTPWNRPAVTTYKFGNHSVRTEQWRYIRYVDGTEELYNHDDDPLEWTNLANDPSYDHIKEQLSAHLPSYNAPDYGEEWPTSVSRNWTDY